VTGVRFALRSALILAGVEALSPVAHAGAWALPEGEERWFASVSRESGDFGQAWRTDSYSELGLGDGWAVNGKLESEIRVGTTYDDRSGVRLGVQRAFPIGERGSISIQTSLLAGESLDGPECLGSGYEARAAIGTSFSMLGREGFVNVEAGRRVRDDCERNIFEVATGLELAPSWKLGLKAWQDGSGAASSAKLSFRPPLTLVCVRSVLAGGRKSPGTSAKKGGWSPPVPASEGCAASFSPG
jgi:hypothetical protein